MKQNNLMTKAGRYSLLALAVLCFAVPALSQKRQVLLDKVVAVVGGSSILESEVTEFADMLVAQQRAQHYTSDRDPKSEALEKLMTQKLLYNQALIDSVDINSGDIESRVEDLIQGMVADEGSIKALEAKHHMAIFNIREMFRRRFEEQAYANAMQGEIVGKVKVIPGEVEHFFNSLDPDSLPLVAEQYVYAQITKYPETLEDAKRRTRERLLSMRERIVTGQSRFEVMARMYSEAYASSLQGGEMEAQLAGLVQPFAEALQELKPGRISEVVETKFGYHIIELLEKKGTNYRFRHILLRPTFSRQELAKPARQLDSIANLIRKDSITFERAALEFSDDPYSKMNGGIVSNQDLLEYHDAYDVKLTDTRFFRESFGEGNGLADYNALRRLKIGEVSDSFQTQDLRGNSLCKIVKLVEIIPTHRASLENDYLEIEQMALTDKQEKVFRKWLDKKIAGMYVYVAPEYRDGEFENPTWLK